MPASILGSIVLLYCISCSLLCIDGFQSISRKRTNPPIAGYRDRTDKNGRDLKYFSASTTSGGDDFLDDNLVAMASKKLDWETAEERNQKPLLDLSSRDFSPEQTRINADENDDVLEWNRGQRWTITVQYLSELGLFLNDEQLPSKTRNLLSPTSNGSILLQNCPQLFRLDPSAIQETAQWIIDEFGLPFLQAAAIQDNNSILLSFRKEDAAYGLEFMSIMMMANAKPVCAASSAFLVEAIRGGIQERTVSAALGAAGNATSKANQSIASETMESLRQLRDANRKKK